MAALGSDSPVPPYPSPRTQNQTPRLRIMKLNHQSPYLLDPCATLGEGVAAKIVTADCIWSCICETEPDGELAGVIAYAHPNNAEVIAVILTACHGLDLPLDAPVGAVAGLVAAARALLAVAEDPAGDVAGASADLAAALASFPG